MRILIVSAFVEPHLGGVEHFVSWLRRRLLASGHDVRLLAVDHPGGADADVLVPARFVGEEMPVVLPGPRVVRTLRREARWSDAVLLQQLGHTLCLLGAVAARLERRRVRSMLHAGGPAVHVNRTRELLTNVYDRTGARWTARLARPVVQSRAAERYAHSRYGARADRFPYPVQPLPARRPPPDPEPPTRLEIVWAARLVGEKAPLDAIATGEHAAAAAPVRLHLYGDGPLADVVRTAAASRSWVVVHGRVSWADVTRAQGAAHVFLSSSVEDTVQVSLLEALAMGVPSVATAVGEAPGYFAGDLARFCVPPGSPEALAAALATLRADYPRWSAAFAANAVRLRREHSEEAAEAAIMATLVDPPTAA